MSRQNYADGVLIEDWNDQTRTYTDFRTQATRPYTAEENAQADAEAAAMTVAANKAALEAGLQNIITRALEYQANAQALLNTTNANINSSPATYIKTNARANKRMAGDLIRLARLAGGLLDSADTGNSE